MKHYFWFGEVGMAAIPSGILVVPVGVYLAGKAWITIAFTGTTLLFLELFVFLSKIIRKCMRADEDAIIDAFGKNEHVKKVFWTFFIAIAGLMLALVVDPAMAQQMVGIIRRIG